MVYQWGGAEYVKYLQYPAHTQRSVIHLIHSEAAWVLNHQWQLKLHWIVHRAHAVHNLILIWYFNLSTWANKHILLMLRRSRLTATRQKIAAVIWIFYLYAINASSVRVAMKSTGNLNLIKLSGNNSAKLFPLRWTPAQALMWSHDECCSQGRKTLTQL